MAKEPHKHDERPDSWLRFERAVDAAVKGGPKHRPKKTENPAKGRRKRAKRP
jgi:hypothetical protein